MKKYIASCVAVLLVVLTSCSSGRVVVQERPPDPVYDRPPAPNPNFVWIGSGYVKKGKSYEYRPGYWASPNNSRHRWIDGHWKQKRKGWVWVQGHWN